MQLKFISHLTLLQLFLQFIPIPAELSHVKTAGRVKLDKMVATVVDVRQNTLDGHVLVSLYVGQNILDGRVRVSFKGVTKRIIIKYLGLYTVYFYLWVYSARNE